MSEKMRKRDSRYDVWITEAKMNDGKWYPVPLWGVGTTRREQRNAALSYCLRNEIWWSLTYNTESLGRRMRSRRYIPVKP